MADSLNPDAAEETLKPLVAAIARQGVEQMLTLAKDQQARVGRQAAIADRLAAKLGEEHERVKALRRAGETSRHLAAHFSRVISKIETAGYARPGDLLFSGRVIDAAGSPMAGAKVRLSDRTGALKLPGSAITDELGEFTLVIRPEGLEPDAPDLALVVEDANERIMGVSADPLHPEPDVWQRVELTAAPPPLPASDAGTGRRGATARRRAPKSRNR